MRNVVTIVTGGTRGDVQPMLALALRLRTRGHSVRMVANPAFVPWIRSLGLEVECLEEPPALDGYAESTERITRSVWPFGAVAEVLRYKPGIPQLLDRVETFASESAVLVCSEASSFTLHVAEALRMPCVHVRFFPGWPTRSFPAPAVPLRTLGSAANLGSHLAFGVLYGVSNRKDINSWRQLRGLRAWRFAQAHREVESRGWPVLFAMSEALVPRSPDWAKNIQMTGFWYLDEQDTPLPPETEAFLNQSSLLVVSLGTLTVRAQRVLDAVIGAVSKLPVRCIITSPAGRETRNVAPNIQVTPPLPHGRLFRHASAVLHHSGAGTAAQAVRAGLPSVTIPMCGEQHFWARRLADRGLGTSPLNWRNVTADQIKRAVETVMTPGWGRDALENCRARILNEAGVDGAVAEIETLLEASTGGRSHSPVNAGHGEA